MNGLLIQWGYIASQAGNVQNYFYPTFSTKCVSMFICSIRTSSADNSQRMLNALMPGTVVPIHRHPMSNETVICLSGKLIEIIYEEDDTATDFPMGMDVQDIPSDRRLKEAARYVLDPSLSNFGCVVPAGAWHTVEVLEPSIIFEAKDGAYGKDGSESLADFRQR